MTKLMTIGVALLGGVACATAFADDNRAAKPAVLVAEPPAAPVYGVDLIGEDGQILRTYSHNGRAYTLGTSGDRYSVRVTNPTAYPVEAVISVDGLDAVDGKTADFVNKRGYVVPAYGQLKIDGFRVSQQDVATFRFSSVKDSYAGRKGQARNVGVIGVAIFEALQEQPIYLPTSEPDIDQRDYYRRAPASKDYDGDDGGAEESEAPRERAPTTNAGAAPAPAQDEPSAEPTSPPPPRVEARTNTVYDKAPSRPCCTEIKVKKERPGLGTEFGERRTSPVTFVRFQRANATTPSVVAEIRYNDRDGLIALGIGLEPVVDTQEVYTRETANPFPSSPYSSPPEGW
jgi:hypothetical protein